MGKADTLEAAAAEVTYPQARRSFLVRARVFTNALENGEIDLPDNIAIYHPTWNNRSLSWKVSMVTTFLCPPCTCRQSLG